VLSVFGGKITTYRKLAEAALAELKPFFPEMKPAWTKDAVLPGGDVPDGDMTEWVAGLERRYPAIPVSLLRALAHRHGSRATTVLGDARTPADLGEDFGVELTAREIEYLRAEEWAIGTDDVLWRRTKCGLSMSPDQRRRVAAFLGA
jgi:glycerol-3-phosphate dehydrogenase